MKTKIPFFCLAGSIFLILILGTSCGTSLEVVPTPTESFQVFLPSSAPSDHEVNTVEIETVVQTEPVITISQIEQLVPVPGVRIEGTESVLTRMPHGVYVTFKTSGLTPGDAVTLWWVIFNKPENCSDGICGQDDAFHLDANGQLLLDESGNVFPNVEGREATVWSLLRADGKVVEQDGTAEFRGHLPVGDATEAAFGPGLLDSMKAEFHIIARTHGPAIPGATHNQLNTPWGGCEPGQFPCVEVQIAVHNPPEN